MSSTLQKKVGNDDRAEPPRLHRHRRRRGNRRQRGGGVRSGRTEARVCDKKLPFDPAKIKGLSEKLLVSHYENNYSGAVRRLNTIAAQLASLDMANAPVFVVNGLKREELIAANSMIMGRALGGGSGWVLLTWSPRDKRLINTWAADHTMTLAGGRPILALDMYEHAYAMDFGARTPAYVDAFMQAIRWDNAAALFEKYAREA
jgi:Fe-Mn family superoxide dismutase